jgi:hypothetical protein
MFLRGFSISAIVATSRSLRMAYHNCDHGGPHMTDQMDHSTMNMMDQLMFVEMECGAESAVCPLEGGDEGFFVCRETSAGTRETLCISFGQGV